MMRALEIMYVYSPMSQRWTKSLLLAKGLYVACMYGAQSAPTKG